MDPVIYEHAIREEDGSMVVGGILPADEHSVPIDQYRAWVGSSAAAALAARESVSAEPSEQ